MLVCAGSRKCLCVRSLSTLQNLRAPGLWCRKSIKIKFHWDVCLLPVLIDFLFGVACPASRRVAKPVKTG